MGKKTRFYLIFMMSVFLTGIMTFPQYSSADEMGYLVIEWENTFGGVDDEFAFTILPSPDGGYLLVGYTSSFGAGNTDGWIVKIDNQGQQEWNRTFGGVNEDRWFDGQTTTDGYVLAGISRSDAPEDPNPREAWAAKVDFNGNTSWIKTYGWPRYDEFLTTVPANDGGYVFGGVSNVNDTIPYNEFWIVKTDTSGNHVWNNTLGRTMAFEMVAVDDGYALLGLDNGASDGGDGYLVKTDNTGQMMWNRTIDLNMFDMCENLIYTSDNGLLIGCNTVTTVDRSRPDVVIIKTDSNGITEWEVTIGDDYGDYPNALLETEGGGYLVSIHTLSTISENSGDNLFVKLDASGNEEWRQEIGYDLEDDFIWDIIEADGGFIAAGRTKSIGAGGSDMWVLKVVESDVTITPTTSTNTNTSESSLNSNLLLLGITLTQILRSKRKKYI
ncbi:MAG: hypothetical protein ACXAD7_05225 [Candidatus Kariarchaeaceae archaeon]|jgi:hypothetical protein